MLIEQYRHPTRLETLHPMDFVSFIYKNLNLYQLYSLILNLYLFFWAREKDIPRKMIQKRILEIVMI